MALYRYSLASRCLYSQVSVSSLGIAGLRCHQHISSATLQGGYRDSEPVSRSRAILTNYIAEDSKTILNVQLSKWRRSHIVQSHTLSALPVQHRIFQNFTSEHCSGSADFEKEYKCPSRLPESFSQLVILDNVTAIKSFYECPVASSVVDSVEAPNQQKSEVREGPGTSTPAKEAKIIMRIRHKKMKKHKLKKLRKRMYFLWRKQKLARKAKRMTIYNKELEEIKKTGDNFDAEAFVREQLMKARKGGYYRNVFESSS